MAKYQYAKDQNGNIFEISDVTPKLRETTIFTCLGCGKQMQANLGNHNEHYFSHNPGEDTLCNRETYLHQIAKAKFLNLFKKCKDKDEPLILEYAGPSKCEESPCPFGMLSPCTKDISAQHFEILPKFSTAQEEQWDENFKPDILLTNPNGDSLYIEIAVTHKCSEKKKNSKVPIIEFLIKDEDDLKIFESGTFFESSESKIKSFNIFKHTTFVPNKQECQKTFPTKRNNNSYDFEKDDCRLIAIYNHDGSIDTKLMEKEDVPNFIGSLKGQATRWLIYNCNDFMEAVGYTDEEQKEFMNDRDIAFKAYFENKSVKVRNPERWVNAIRNMQIEK